MKAIIKENEERITIQSEYGLEWYKLAFEPNTDYIVRAVTGVLHDHAITYMTNMEDTVKNAPSRISVNASNNTWAVKHNGYNIVEINMLAFSQFWPCLVPAKMPVTCYFDGVLLAVYALLTRYASIESERYGYSEYKVPFVLGVENDPKLKSYAKPGNRLRIYPCSDMLLTDTAGFTNFLECVYTGVYQSTVHSVYGRSA